MTRNEYIARLEAAFEAVLNPKNVPPPTEADVREHDRKVARRRALDDAARRAPQQEALQLP